MQNRCDIIRPSLRRRALRPELASYLAIRQNLGLALRHAATPMSTSTQGLTSEVEPDPATATMPLGPR